MQLTRPTRYVLAALALLGELSAVCGGDDKPMTLSLRPRPSRSTLSTMASRASPLAREPP